MFRWLRIILAAVSLLCLTILLAFPAGMLVATLGWLPHIQFLPAVLSGSVVASVAILLVTLICGRIYCSIMCPLGIAQDFAAFVSRLVFRRGREKFARGCLHGSWHRYLVVVFCLIGWLLGLSVLIVDPYGIFGRSVASVMAVLRMQLGVVVIMSLCVFVAILLCAALKPRFWCNEICPVGTVLGLVSRFAIFKVRIDTAKCVNCNLCVAACNGRCISADKGKMIDHSRCVDCLNCVGVCKKGALSWR